MAIQKQALNINFSQGLDTKTDPFQVPAGRFLSLENSVFDKAGMLTKRNGYGPLTSLPDSTSKFVTTFNGNLTAIGTDLKALSIGGAAWSTKGSLHPVSVSTLPLVRSNHTQIQADSVIASNGLVCTVYTETTPINGVATPTYKYVVSDSITGQNVLAPMTLSTADTTYGTPRVFLLGNYFIVLFTTKVVSTYHLQYIAINVTSPSIVTAPADIASAYTPAVSLAFDGVVVGDNLYIAYNTTSGGQSVKVTYLTSTLNLITPVTFALSIGTMFSLCADISNPANPIIYVSFYDLGTSVGNVLAVNAQLNTVLAPVSIIVAEPVANLTSTATNGVVTFFYEVTNSYGYDSSIATNYIKTVTVTQAGVVGTASVLIRSLGLASKAFQVNSVSYFLGIYGSLYQPTYFLVNSSGDVIAKLAYSNAGYYYSFGLPGVSIDSNTASIAYLYRDLVQAVNKTQGVSSASGVYAQLGINLVSFNLGISSISTSEIGSNLNISGGFLWAYDGVNPVEQEFFLYPEYIETSNPAHPTPTGDTTNTSNQITNLSATTNIVVGMNISGTGIPANTTVTAISGSTITISNAATATNVGTTLTFTGNMTNQQYFYQVTYEWSDNQGNLFRSAPSIPTSITTSSTGLFTLVNIPTLRLTYKISSPVKIVVYRWSAAQQTYYQTTSITVPTLNDTTIDYITFEDINADDQIIGNNILYTTGGVLENIAPPATDLIALFNNRLWLVDAEDRNLLWYSKQVIEATPVEMSDLLTLYIAPSTASQGSTGPITAIAPMDDKLIIFKNNALGYINGVGPDNTGANNGYSDFVLINSVVGCTNQQSIVFMPQGLMFQSSKGIWLLGRDLSTQYIGAPVEEFTTGATVQSAVNVPSTNQVRFTLDSGITLMYDYYYGQWGTFTNVPAISSTIYENLHTYINSLGQVFQETPGTYLDNTSPVLMSFTSSWFNLAGLQGFERFYQLYLLGKYITPFKLSVQLGFDYNSSAQQYTTVVPESRSSNWGSEALWGSGNYWGGLSNVFEARVFPQIQKCESFQISISEIYDSSQGIAAGAGLTLSGMNLVVGMKKGYRTSTAAKSFG